MEILEEVLSLETVTGALTELPRLHLDNRVEELLLHPAEPGGLSGESHQFPKYY
jgi:hypothetical protein